MREGVKNERKEKGKKATKDIGKTKEIKKEKW